MAAKKTAQKPAPKTPVAAQKSPTKTPASPKKTGASAVKDTAKTVATNPKKKLLARLKIQRKHYEKPPKTKLHNVPGSFRLFGTACKTVAACWKPLLILLVIYGVLNVILVRDFTFTNLNNVQSGIGDIFGNPNNKLSSGFSAFTYLVANDAGSNGNGVYQFILLMVMSLAIIWMLRQHAAGEKFRARDMFYAGMYPLVPFFLMLCVWALEMAPLILGGSLFAFVLENSIAVNVFEVCLAVLGFALLALWSLYMICASSFALYIVTLPNVAPLKALRTGRELVRFRRFVLMRKVLFMPLALGLVTAAITMPLALIVPVVAPWIFFGITLILLPLFHSYMYTLYRASL